MTVWRAIWPLDVLYLRGNRLFGGGGDHSEALMPPWPSVFAGAIRSRMLMDAGVDLGKFTDERAEAPAVLTTVLGTPSKPGTFRIAGMALVAPGGNGVTRAVFPLPADLAVTRKTGEPIEITRLAPRPWPEGVSTSVSTAKAMVLCRAEPAKAEAGYWLTAEGFGAWLRGGTPAPRQLVHCSALWKPDPRLGIALDRSTRTSAKGKLYTSDTVAMVRGTGFLVSIAGAGEEQVPSSGLLRLGGDGRGAEITRWTGDMPEGVNPAEGEPFALYLETPGLFPSGWVPPGVDPATLRLEAPGVSGRLAAASVPRHH